MVLFFVDFLAVWSNSGCALFLSHIAVCSSLISRLFSLIALLSTSQNRKNPIWIRGPYAHCALCDDAERVSLDRRSISMWRQIP